MIKNKYGQYFTSMAIADFMVSLLDKEKGATILEPSSGEGVFIDTLMKQGYHNIDAFEIDSSIIKHDCVSNQSFISASITKEYDAIIGNPPFIRWKNLEPELKLELNDSTLWTQNFNALCDYLFIFIAKSVELLKENGELVFICSDYWLNSTNGESLRNFLLKRGYFEAIYLYKETPMFSGVTASIMIFKFRKARNQAHKDIQLFLYSNRNKPSFEDLKNLRNYQIFSIPPFSINHRWVLATSEEQKEAFNLEEACKIKSSLFSESNQISKIGDYFDIGNGLVSGLDKAFNVSEYYSALSEKEKGCTIDVVKAKDIHPYRFSSISKYVFIEDKSLSEQDFTRNYGNIFQNILPYKERLEQRYQYGRTIDFWSFTFPRNLQLFRRQNKRILVPCKDRISKRHAFRFCLANKNIYPLQDVTGLVMKNNCNESIEYTTAYLNTPQVYNWVMLNGIIKGEIVEFSEKPLSSIPFRCIKWDNAEEVLIHEKITHIIQNSIKTGQDIPTNEINQYFNLLLS